MKLCFPAKSAYVICIKELCVLQNVQFNIRIACRLKLSLSLLVGLTRQQQAEQSVG